MGAETMAEYPANLAGVPDARQKSALTRRLSWRPVR